MVDIRAMTVAGVVRAIGQGGTLAGVVIGPIAAVLALLDDRPTAAFFHLVGGAFCLGVLAYTMLVTRIVANAEQADEAGDEELDQLIAVMFAIAAQQHRIVPRMHAPAALQAQGDALVNYIHRNFERRGSHGPEPDPR